MAEEKGAIFETRAEAEKQAGPNSSAIWQQELLLASSAEEDWRKTSQRVIEIYQGASKSVASAGPSRGLGYWSGPVRFNILWSNTEVLWGGLFRRMPQPDVRRRYRREDENQDDTARQVATVIERALSWSGDQFDDETPIAQSVKDYLLPGRGVVRILYNAKIGTRDEQAFSIDPVTGETRTEIIQTEFVADQTLKTRRVFWADYRESPARAWKDVRWVAYGHDMTRDHLVKEFPEHGPKVNLGKLQAGADQVKDPNDAFKRARVWEIWDKARRQRHWVAEGYEFILETEDDPYNLTDFFPQPPPIYSVHSPDDRIPTAEFVLYEKLAEELDRVTTRTTHLIEAMKRRGAYDSRFDETLSQLSDAGDNIFVPLDNWTALQEAGGLERVFASEDLRPFVEPLKALFAQRERVINMIYEITGISDIMRGDTNPNETLGAQEIKARFGSLRFQKRQDEIGKYVKNLYRIKGEIIAEKFTVPILQEITGLEVTPEMEQVMRSDKLRSFGVDVQSDETALEQSEEEKKSRVQFLGAVTPYLREALEIATAQPLLGPLLFDFLEFGMRGFKVSRSLEESVETTRQKLEAQAKAQAQQPNEENKEVAAELQMEQQKTMGLLQIKGQEAQANAQLDQQKAAEDARLKAQEQADQAALDRKKLAQEVALEIRKQDIDAALRAREQSERIVN